MPEWYLVSSHIKNKNHQIIKKYKIILSTIQDWRPADGILCLHGASLLLHLPVGVRSQLCVRPSARHHFPAGPLQQEADDGGSTTDGWPQHLPHGELPVHYSPTVMLAPCNSRPVIFVLLHVVSFWWLVMLCLHFCFKTLSRHNLCQISASTSPSWWARRSLFTCTDGSFYAPAIRRMVEGHLVLPLSMRACVRPSFGPSVIKIWCPLNNFLKTASIQSKLGMLIYNIKTQTCRVRFGLQSTNFWQSYGPFIKT